jgi:hypothetical protein
MVNAVEIAWRELRGNPPTVIFGAMTEDQAIEVIDELRLSQAQKSSLRSASAQERTRMYFEMAYEASARRAAEAVNELRRWLSARQIFISPTIYSGFEAILEHLDSVLINVPHRGDPDRNRATVAVVRALDGLEDKKRVLAVAILRRFGFEEGVGES